MDVCLVVSVVCYLVEVSATSWSLVQRSPTDCGASLCVWSRNLVNEKALAHWGLLRQKQTKKGSSNFRILDLSQLVKQSDILVTLSLCS